MVGFPTCMGSHFAGTFLIFVPDRFGMFLVGLLNRLGKRNSRKRDKPRNLRNNQEKSKIEKEQRRANRKGKVQVGKPPRLNTPRPPTLQNDISNSQTLNTRMRDQGLDLC